MNKVSDVKLKNLLQDYRRERDALFGPERGRLYALIQERYSEYPAEAKALIAVFDDQEMRSLLLAPAGKLTTTEVADNVRAVGRTSQPDLIRGAIETWADALGVKIVDNAPVRTPPQPKNAQAQAGGPQPQDWRILLSLAAIALGLFLTGGEALNGIFGKPTAEGYYATQALLAHPIQYLADRPLSVLGSLFFTGGLIGLFNR